jgi:hypothetical protein
MSAAQKNKLTCPPLFGERETGTESLTWVLLELLLKQLHKRQAVSGRPREPTDNVVLYAADFLRRVLEDSGAERNLSIGHHSYLVPSAYIEHGSGMEIVLAVGGM